MKIPQILTLILIFHNILFLYKKKAPNITTRSFHQLLLLLGVEDRTRTGDIQNHNLTL